MSNGTVIAKFAVGEAVADGIGAVCVREREGRAHYTVFVNGGNLPDGSDEKVFGNVYLALQYACDICKALVTEI